jgi:hypothetical protein
LWQQVNTGLFYAGEETMTATLERPTLPSTKPRDTDLDTLADIIRLIYINEDRRVFAITDPEAFIGETIADAWGGEDRLGPIATAKVVQSIDYYGNRWLWTGDISATGHPELDARLRILRQLHDDEVDRLYAVGNPETYLTQMAAQWRATYTPLTIAWFTRTAKISLHFCWPWEPPDCAPQPRGWW